MKHDIFSLSFALLLVLGTGCQRGSEMDVDREDARPRRLLTATLETEAPTRTTLGGPVGGVYYPFWMDTDEVAVYGEGVRQPDKYTLHAGGGTPKATFEGPWSGGNLVGLYPYSDLAEEGLSGNVLTLELPAEQQYMENSFGDGAYPMVSVSRSDTLSFKNLCAVLKLTIMSRITMQMEAIRFIAHDPAMSVSGKGTVRTDFKTEPQLVMAPGGFREVTLRCSDTDVNNVERRVFYLVIPPGTYKGGFDLEIISPAGKMTKSIDTDVVFKRSEYRAVPTFIFEPEEAFVPEPEAVDLGLSVQWASFNMGAYKASDPGTYYAWGETQKKASYSWGTYAFGSSSNFTKYNASDKKTVLEPEDDAAYVQLRGKWRLPTHPEMRELIELCDWTWNENRGAYEVKGPNGHTIFMPCAASSEGKDGYGQTSFGYYWASDIESADGKYRPYYLYFSRESLPGVYDNGARYLGASVRPVYGDPPVPVTRVSLNLSQVEIAVGEQVTLQATVLPSNASVPLVTWSSSDESVAYVSPSGVVTGAGKGTATITVTTVDGGKEASCRVTVVPGGAQVPELIDMGLSVKWASFNLGASKPEEYGYYYAWGETEQKSLYRWSTYKWCEGSNKTLTKYNNLAEYGFNGFVDNKMELDPEDDAASVLLGAPWRIPTMEEWTELVDNSTWTWTTENGINGFRVVSTVNGRSLFFPAAGYGPYMDNNLAAGLAARYWSSTLVDFEPSSAYAIYFEEERKPWPQADYNARESRHSIRPVYGAGAVRPGSVTLDRSEQDLPVGGKVTLKATVLPANAAVKDVEWSSSDYTVADVSDAGVVTGISEGTAVITVKTVSGGRTANCRVTVRPGVIVTPDWVDLGLSVQWATFNLGAIRPAEPGLYFAWGSPQPKGIISYGDQPWYSSNDGTYTKYNWLSDWGTVDYKYFLDPEDDAATANLGGRWRTPTESELQELMYHCEWTYVEDYQGTGQSGCIVRSLKDGYTDQSVFLPSGTYQSSYLQFSKWYIQGPYAPAGMQVGEEALEFADEGGVASTLGRWGTYLIRPVYGPRYAWSVVPGDVEFGSVPVGSSATKTVTVTNTGEAVIEISVDANSPFEMDVYSLALSKGESKTVKITFTPTEKKDYKGLTSIIVEGISNNWVNVFGKGI